MHVLMFVVQYVLAVSVYCYDVIHSVFFGFCLVGEAGPDPTVFFLREDDIFVLDIYVCVCFYCRW